MMCAYGHDEVPQPYGEDGCIECTRGPADGSCEACRGEEAKAQSAGTNAVPLPQLLVLAALAGAAALVGARRGRVR